MFNDNLPTLEEIFDWIDSLPERTPNKEEEEEEEDELIEWEKNYWKDTCGGLV